MLPLVLLPAMLCDAELYRAQIAVLADVVQSLPFPAAESPLVEAAQAVLHQAPPRFALAGTSAGGNLALEILAAAPARVAGLWLMGSNPGVDGDPGGGRARSARVRAGEFDAVVDELTAQAVHAGGPRAGEAMATFRRMAHRAGPDGFVRQNEALLARRDRSSVVDRLAVPTLLLWGRQDRFSGVDRALDIAARAAAAELVVLDDCGHLPTVEQPEACARAARQWLRRCSVD